MKQLKPWLLLAGAALVLAACGGGGGGGGDSPPPQSASPLDGLPPEATQSVSGWINYVEALIKAPDVNGREGVDLSAIASITLPGSNDEAMPLPQ